MNKETRIALEGSIAKWEAIVDGTGIDKGVANCPLCHLFSYTKDCKGCPVAEVSGDTGCNNTPYVAYSRAKRLSLDSITEAAQAELDFLKSLR